MPDPEIAAMETISDALENLEAAARERVLKWAADRFDVNVRPDKSPQPVGGKTNVSPTESEFPTFVDLLDAVAPRTDLEKALTGAYWLQELEGTAAWPSQTVNELLKDTGNGLSNVTATLTKAQNRKPALVRQVSKSGKNAQARKQYKLTSAGIALVNRGLNRSDVDQTEVDEG